ncbi:hypothetical protein ACNHKD_12745 [Methylocystis sp. JAN1]|uniref:hypothetical protein n=1 Tax=Methylocystis sp. JAN1 TaxID=3397211 RepID=UPI003FA2C2DC
MNDDLIRSRLTNLLEKTASAENLSGGGYWVGDKAEERRVLDDWKTGRLSWKMVRRAAKLGLEALDNGDHEAALEFAWMSTSYYIEVLENRVRPSDLAELGRPAKKRGLKPKNKLPG